MRRSRSRVTHDSMSLGYNRYLLLEKEYWNDRKSIIWSFLLMRSLKNTQVRQYWRTGYVATKNRVCGRKNVLCGNNYLGELKGETDVANIT
jgi:hypothetical protein